MAKLARINILASGNQQAIDLVNNFVIELIFAKIIGGKSRSRGPLFKFAKDNMAFWAPLDFQLSDQFIASLSIPLPAPQGEAEDFTVVRVCGSLIRDASAHDPILLETRMANFLEILKEIRTPQAHPECFLMVAFLAQSMTLFGQANLPSFGDLEPMFASFRFMLNNLKETASLKPDSIENINFLERSLHMFSEQHEVMLKAGYMSAEGRTGDGKKLLLWKTFDEDLMRMQSGETKAYYLMTESHAVVGCFRKTSDIDGEWTIFDSSEYHPNQRRPLYKRYYDVPIAWVIKLLQRLAVRTTLAENTEVHPTDCMMKLSKTTVVPQRGHSCKVKSIWMFALYVLGRPCYTQFKVIANLSLLKSVHATLQASPSTRMTVFGHTFESAYLPVWNYVKDSRVLERRLKHQISRMASLAPHFDDDAPVDEPLETIESAQQECMNLLENHCAAYEIELP